MTCPRCQTPITGKGTTGLCQPCVSGANGARNMVKSGATCGKHGRAKRIWIRKAQSLLKRLEERP